jgi:hypothetical protein
MRLIFAAAFAASIVFAEPVAAQDAGTEDADALIAEMDATLPMLARLAGRPAPPSMGPIFRPLFTAALEERPEAPEGSLIIGFDLNANPNERAELLADVAACAALRPGSVVLRFRRFVEGEVEGHECVLTGPGEEADYDGWTLLYETVTNGPGGRLNARFGAAAVAESGAVDEARGMIDLHRADLLVVGDRVVGEARSAFGHAPPVRSRPVEPRPLDTETQRAIKEFEGQFIEMGKALGVDAVTLPEGFLLSLFQTATPSLPEGDERDWGNSVDFDIVVDQTTGALEPLTETDEARLCQNDFAGPAIAYEALNMAGYVGHQCVFEREEDGVVATYSRIILELDGQRITIINGFAFVIDGDPGATRRLMRDNLVPTIAMSQGLARYAVAILGAQNGAQVDPDAAFRWVEDVSERWQGNIGD